MAPALAPLTASSSRSSSSSRRSSTPQVNAPKTPPPCKREREPPLVTARLSGLEHGSIGGQEIRSSPAALTSGIPLGRADELQKGAPHQAW